MKLITKYKKNNMNKILKEEIERFQLLSKYDTTKTLDENSQSSEIITELSGNWLSSLLGREAGVVSKALAKELDVLFKTIPTEMKAFGNDTAEVISRLNSKFYERDELGALRKTIFINSTDDTIRVQIADDMVRGKNFQDVFSSTKEKKILDVLTKTYKYSGKDAQLLIQRYKKQGGKFLDEIKATTKGSTKGSTKGKTRQQSNDWDSYYGGGNRNQRITVASTAWRIVKGAGVVAGFIFNNFWRLLWIAGGLWVAYEIWKILSKGGNTGYPKCLEKAITPTDLEKIRTEKRSHLPLKNTGNEFIDENGGGNFYLDKKFETENKQHKGTWSYDEKSSEVVVKLDNGDEHSIVCEDVPSWDEDDNLSDDPINVTQTEKQKLISSWSGSYNECKEFPMSLGCKNEGIIGTVQICLGLPKDGKFSPKVLDALDSEGYGLELTFDNYQLIKGKCGMSSAKSGFASNL